VKAIILAAGLGSRLGKVTSNNHKSLIKLGKKTILGRLVEQFEACGIKNIQIICGHQKKKIDKKFANYKTFYYPKYKTTNNLHTLYYFKKLLNDDCIISFADIVLDKKIIRRLINVKKKITLCIDTLQYRKGTMKIDLYKDQIKYIGNSPKTKSGNYIGILKIKKKSLKSFISSMKELLKKSNNFYFTEAINLMINKKYYKINYLDVKKNFWFEIDNYNDLTYARKKINAIEN
jgi:L-glutamine-phosphate cytidylyltransferase